MQWLLSIQTLQIHYDNPYTQMLLYNLQSHGRQKIILSKVQDTVLE